MKTVLILNFPAEGHVNPTLGITKAFSDKGYDVHYISTEKYKKRLEAAGATVHLHRDLLRTTPIHVGSPNGILDFVKIHIKTSLDILQIVKDLSKSIEFDFVYYDKFGAGELVRDYLDIPGVSSSASFLFGEEHLKILPLHPESGAPLELDQECKDLLEKMKETYGVAPKNLVQFMNNKGELNVVYTSRYFQPESDRFGDECLFIGPSFPKRAEKTDFPIEQLKDEKVIYISMGTVLDHTEDFFNLCIDAFSGFNGKVVIAAGEKADLTKLKQAPENFIIAPYVPQLEVLEESDVFITHGGMNSTSEGLYFETPLVVIPMGGDQFVVADQVEKVGAGKVLKKEELSESLLKETIQEVMNNRSYAEKAKEIGQSLKAAGGSKKAADSILEAVKQKTQSANA